MENTSDRHRIGNGLVGFGWCLFGIALVISTKWEDRDALNVTRSLLASAGWCITLGWLIRLSRGFWSGGRWNLFRLFRWMDHLESFLAPVTAVTATPARRICLGVVSGVTLFAFLMRVF
ncbi:MAG: hypothetical protein V4671_28870 [Armatimonadota bacterium]